MCSETGSEHKLLEENQTLLIEGGEKQNHMNGCKLNSNESHGMITIDETTEQEGLLALSKKPTRIDIENNIGTPVTRATHNKMNANPETTLWYVRESND